MMSECELFCDKKPADGAASAERQPEATQGTRHRFVLCRAEAPGNLSRSSQVVSRLFGKGYTAEVSEQNTVTVMRGENAVGFLGRMPAPIPNHEAELNARWQLPLAWRQARDCHALLARCRAQSGRRGSDAHSVGRRAHALGAGGIETL
jgi:hypothetical protein